MATDLRQEWAESYPEGSHLVLDLDEQLVRWFRKLTSQVRN